MAVFRVEKSTSYSVISNYHFKEKQMSLKAKGLLSEMLSLKESWDYSSRGLAAINKEGKNTINRILQELEEFGYLTRSPMKSENGQILDWEYTIYEMPQVTESVISVQFTPCTKNEDLENEDLENRYNNKILNNKVPTNNKRKNNKKESFDNSRESLRRNLREFKKPTIEEIKQFLKQLTDEIVESNKKLPKDQHRKLPTVDAESFYYYYESVDWYIGNKKMKNWQATIRRWIRNDFKSGNRCNRNETIPEWFDKKCENSVVSEEAKSEMNKILEDLSCM